MKEEIKTVKDMKHNANFLDEPDKFEWAIRYDELKAEAVNEINNLDELEYILGLMSEPEKRILIKYIKWKNNLTEEDLKNEN